MLIMMTLKIHPAPRSRNPADQPHKASPGTIRISVIPLVSVDGLEKQFRGPERRIPDLGKNAYYKGFLNSMLPCFLQPG